MSCSRFVGRTSSHDILSNSLHDSATVLILIPERQIHSIIALINAHMVDAMDAMDCAYVCEYQCDLEPLQSS